MRNKTLLTCEKTPHRHTKPLCTPQRLDSSWFSPALHPSPREENLSTSIRIRETHRNFPDVLSLWMDSDRTLNMWERMFVWGCSWRRCYKGLEIKIPPIMDQAPGVTYAIVSWVSLLVHPPTDFTGHQSLHPAEQRSLRLPNLITSSDSGSHVYYEALICYYSEESRGINKKSSLQNHQHLRTP